MSKRDDDDDNDHYDDDEDEDDYDDDDDDDGDDDLPCIRPGSIVDESILEESEEDKGDANVVPHIDCLRCEVLLSDC